MIYKLNKNEIKNKLLEIVSSDQLLIDSLMRDHTTFRIGGPADFIVFPENEEQLASQRSAKPMTFPSF